MNLKQAFDEIEGLSFSASLGVANDFKTFLRGAVANDAVRFLFGEHSPDHRLQIARQAIRLARRATDPRYESRWDAALTVYLWTLRAAGDDALVRLVADSLAPSGQLWWARKLALNVLAETRHVSSALTTAYQVQSNWPTIQAASDAGETVASIPAKEQSGELLETNASNTAPDASVDVQSGSVDQPGLIVEAVAAN